jgi:hypothetical protein
MSRPSNILLPTPSKHEERIMAKLTDTQSQAPFGA